MQQNRDLELCPSVKRMINFTASRPVIGNTIVLHPRLVLVLRLAAPSMRSCSDYGRFCKMAGMSGKCSGDTSSSVVSILSHIKTLRPSELARKTKRIM